MHYDRVLTTGNTGGPHSTVIETGGLCAVVGCEATAIASGMCNMHYRRVRIKGSAGTFQRLRARVGSGLDAKGYRIVGGKKEHRLVMESVLGRPLRPGENVHHRDGQKSNNDPANLELWVKTQPCGQRVTDRVSAALALLKQYPEVACAAGYTLLALESQAASEYFWDAETEHPGESPALA